MSLSAPISPSDTGEDTSSLTQPDGFQENSGPAAQRFVEHFRKTAYWKVCGVTSKVSILFILSDVADWLVKLLLFMDTASRK
jgi:hypothetical protein